VDEKLCHTAPAREARMRSLCPAVFRQAYARWPVSFCLAIALVVLTVDYFTGRAIQFPIVYAIPVGLAAWKRKRAVAYAAALSLPAMRLSFHFPWREVESLLVGAINLPIAAFSLSLYAYLIERTSRQTQELEKEVRKLEGILPICAACKRIRNEKGVYEQMETYITNHSEASFTHGLCPECLPKYFSGATRVAG
jgi:hypothetical protein